MAKKLVGWWFNPKDDMAQTMGTLDRKNTMEFTSPTTGIENDWVLVLEDASKGYGEPGK